MGAAKDFRMTTIGSRLAVEDVRSHRSAETFLLFAGVQADTRGGLRDLVGTFATEAEGRRAFSRLGHQHPAYGGWAELAGIDRSGRIRHISWFGLTPDPSGPDAPDGRPAAVIGLRRQSPCRLVAVADETPAGDVSSF